MSAARSDERGAIGFAEKVLELLEEGRYTATYKYAVLLALMDLCLEHTEASGAPPGVLTTRDLAEKIVEIYWPHTVPFAQPLSQAILRQNTSGQAEIVSAIARFRSFHAQDASVPRWQARIAGPEQYARLVRFVEWKLIEMPLPRLQTMGAVRDEFIYEIRWGPKVSKKEVDPPSAGEPSPFDNRIYLKPSVGEYLLQLNGLLRPLLHRRWARLVAQWNKLPDSQLEDFLFGAERVATAKVRAGLWAIQDKRCFYCQARLVDPSKGQVDHFVPWARYPDNGIDNLVVADTACNGYKSSSLAASEHVVRWSQRFSATTSETRQLGQLARDSGWDQNQQRTLSVGRGIYLRLPEGAKLWLQAKQFVEFDRPAVEAALRVS